MSTLFQTILNYGEHHRIWPYFDVDTNRLYVSVALSRPFAEQLCKLFVSKDYGESWSEIADFYSMDKRNTTTGQPFVTKSGVIFVPIWNAGFYTYGETWLSIYKSEDNGISWEKVYEDPRGTYGKHFFENSTDGSVYLGAGVGGGGSQGKVSYTPAKAYILKSPNMGKTWKKILKVDYPTALYSGIALDEKTILVTAREKRTVFYSANGGISWIETYMGNTVRNISYFKEFGKFVITSNSAIYVSSDGIAWTRLNAPIKLLVLRYPTLRKEKIYMNSAGGYSSVISTDLERWFMNCDVTQKTGSNLFTRMAMSNDYTFLGNELNGVLLRVKLPIDDDGPINLSQLLEFNFRSLISITKQMFSRIYKGSV